MSSPKPRKRKADALESGEDDDAKSPATAPASDSPAHLPAPCLAAILNFLWYTDVRRCMLAGKIMAVEAAGYVEALNITKASELVVPAARRFTNVSEVNILCLLDDKYGAICTKTATQAIPFLSSFPNLREASFGGMYIEETARNTEVWRCHDYDVQHCPGPEDHQVIFRSLIEHLCGAFRSKSLRNDLEIIGLVVHKQLDCSLSLLRERESLLWYEREDSDRPCRCCRNIVSSFPFEPIFDSFAGTHALCLPKAELLKMLLGRNGGIAALRSDAGRRALIELFEHILPRKFLYLDNNRFEKEFAKKVKNLGAKPRSESGFYFYRTIDETDRDFNEVIALAKSSMTLRNVIKDIPRSQLLLLWPFKPFTEEQGRTMYSRQTFDTLVQAGLNLSANDYILVDVEKEHPAVKERL